MRRRNGKVETENVRTQQSLRTLMGEFDMRVYWWQESPRAAEVTRGRRCVNCDDQLTAFVPIPGRQSMELLCVKCMVGMLVDAKIIPDPDVPTLTDTALAVAGLMQVLEDTGG